MESLAEKIYNTINLHGDSHVKHYGLQTSILFMICGYT